MRPFLKETINNFKKSDTWEIQLTIANNFISFVENHEEPVIHSEKLSDRNHD